MRENTVFPTLNKAELVQRCMMLIGSDSEELFRGFPGEKTLRAIAELLAWPWFQRAWVIQEFTVAPEVDTFIGRCKCEWGSFMVAFGYAFREAKVRWTPILNSNERLRADFYRGLSQVLEMYELRNQFHDGKEEQKYKLRRLSLLLARCRTADATHAVDKIYVLLELSADFHRYKPDYTKSKAEEYLHIAKCMIAKGRQEESHSDAKEMLYEAARSDRRGEDLPSWIPDWSEVPIRMNLGLSLSKSGGWLFKAGGKQHREGPKPVLNVDGNVLRTMGFVFGTILNLGEAEDEVVLDRLPDLARVLTVVGEMLEIRKKRNQYPTGQEMLSVISTILEADQVRIKDSSDVTSLYDDNIARDILLEIQMERLEEGRMSLPGGVTDEMAAYQGSRSLPTSRYHQRNR